MDMTWWKQYGGQNITANGNNISTLVGQPGANVRSPKNATSGAGQSVYGIYSYATGLFLTNTVISNLQSMRIWFSQCNNIFVGGPAGQSDLGYTSSPGSVIGVDIIDILYQYASVSVSNMTEGNSTATDPDAPTAYLQPVQANNSMLTTRFRQQTNYSQKSRGVLWSTMIPPNSATPQERPVVSRPVSSTRANLQFTDTLSKVNATQLTPQLRQAFYCCAMNTNLIDKDLCLRIRFRQLPVPG